MALGMDSQLVGQMSQLALAIASPTPTRARRLDGLLRFDAEAHAEAWLAKHGDLWHPRKGLTLRLRPRAVGEEWVLCTHWSGRPWCLSQKRVPVQVRAGDVR